MSEINKVDYGVLMARASDGYAEVRFDEKHYLDAALKNGRERYPDVIFSTLTGHGDWVLCVSVDCQHVEVGADGR